MVKNILIILCLALVVPLNLYAERKYERIDLEIDGIPNTVYYWVRKPNSFDPAKTWPLMIHMPGSNQADKETVESNCAIRDMNYWSPKQGTEEWFFISAWYGNKNDAYPHGFKKNAVTITDAMIVDALARYPIDRSRVFWQSYSQGGVLVKQMLDKYAKSTPVKLAGMLFNDSNCQGGNPAAACITPDTAIFVGVGELDIPSETGLECVKEAEKWARMFKNKCKDLEHHVVEGQKHELNAEHFSLIKAWLQRIDKDISERNIDTAAKNSAKARSMAKRGQLGIALNLTEMALAETAEDNPRFALAQAIAAAIKAELDLLQTAYAAWDDADPLPAATALLALNKLFKGHPAGDSTTALIKARLKEPNVSRIFGKAKKQLKDLTGPIGERVRAVFDS